MSVEPVADWRLPEGGITAANLDHLPGLKLPAHTELIDGGLFFPGPQRAFHTAMAELMEAGLNATRPDGFVVQSRTPLALDLRTKVRPDILVAEIEFPAEIESEPALDRPSDPAEAVRLAVEVVTPISEIRDRQLKPGLYAEAGIAHFWRVEEEAGKPVVYVYELDPATATYFLTGTHRDWIRRTVPYRIDIDLRGYLVST